MEIDLSAYNDAISVIKSDLMTIEQQKQDFTPMAEFKQFDSLLKTLDFRINDFQQVLPTVDPRCGLLYAGGLVLKHIFWNRDCYRYSLDTLSSRRIAAKKFQHGPFCVKSVNLYEGFRKICICITQVD